MLVRRVRDSSGVGPQHGLYTMKAAGFLISALGDSCGRIGGQISTAMRGTPWTTDDSRRQSSRALLF